MALNRRGKTKTLQQHFSVLENEGITLSWPGHATEIILFTHSLGCAEKTIPSHLDLFLISQILIQTKPSEIVCFNIHWSQVRQFSVFGCLLVVDPSPSMHYSLILGSLTDLSQPRCL